MRLSLAGWSLHKLFQRSRYPLKLVHFPVFTKEELGLDAIELNSPFFESREPDYLKRLVAAGQRAGVKLLNIAVDEDGDLASEDQEECERGIENYGRWVPVARELGCTAIRANSGGKQVTDHAKAVAACIDSFRKLCDRGKADGITILMENHGGISSDADTIVKIMEAVRETHGADAIGTLPDFGNWPEGVDRFESLNKIMPFAKAVHAKVSDMDERLRHPKVSDMDERLRHPKFDLDRCVAIVKESGYDGYLGIEFEGRGEPVEGVRRAIRKLTPLL